MKEMMKIAILSPSAPPLGGGGVTSAHYNLFRILKNRGIKVKLFTFKDNKPQNIENEEVIRHGTPPIISGLISLTSAVLFRFLSGARLACEMKDIFQSAVGSLQINIPLLRFHPDILVLPDHGAPGLFILKPRQCKTILISHHNPARFLQAPLLRSEPDIHMALRVENRVLNKVDSVICPSIYMKEVFEKTYKFDGPVSVLPNMIDDELISSIIAFDTIKMLALPSDAPVIYIPSAGSKLKGSQFVFEIVRRLATFHGEKLGFYLSGDIDADLKFELQYLPDNAKVYMPGHVSYLENIALVKSCSFGVSPTLIENFGMAVLEAMYCGIPMVTFDIGGNRDIVISGENGFMANYLDIESLICSAQKLLDRRLRKDIREQTMKSVRSKFDSDVLAERFLKLVSE
jgi:glycosyltransferase involved in cell wall biosynthesis